MRIAVCGGESALRTQLKKFIGRWSGLRGCPCRVSVYPGGKALLFEAAGSCPFDLILLDAGLSGLGGAELVRTIREADRSVPLAFLTSRPGYVSEDCEVSAPPCLLKPVAEEELFPLLDLARERAEREPSYLTLHIGGQARRVDQKDILYLEAQGRAVRVRTVDAVLEAGTSLLSLAGQLGEDFAAAHRGYLVNLRHVERVGRGACLLENGESVPVSRGNWEKLSRAFAGYRREA